MSDQAAAALSTLIERVPVAMLLVDGQGVIDEANAEAQALFGWARDELVGSPVEVLVPGPVRQLHAERRGAFAAMPHPRPMGSASRLEARHRDGHLFPVDVMLAPLGDGRTLATVIDRSDLRVAEDALRRSTATFRHVMENIQDIVYVVRLEGAQSGATRVELLSDHVERVVGWTVQEFMRDPGLWMRCIHPDDLPSVSAKTQEMFETRRAVVRTYRLEHKHTGQWRLMEDHAAPLLDARGFAVGYCGVARDVTDELAARTQSVMNERLAALGLLAAGVSHELGNPLTFVLASVDLAATLLRDKPAELDRARAALDDALEGVARMREILADLSQISRDADQVGLIDARRAADLAARLAFATLDERATLTRQFQDVPPVRGDETKLAQVILNLLLNAAHAMPAEHHGQVTVRVAATAGPEVVVEVDDDGEGIRPEVLPRVFDPFFTTKPSGLGTGLGLYVCQTIVREMGGDIRIESEPGKGTRVRVVLPAVLV